MQTLRQSNTDQHHVSRQRMFPIEGMQAADASQKLQWSDAMLLGHGSLDTAHQEFVEVVAALADCTQHSALACLQAVVDHLRSHFEMEREWMVKTDFPATECHLGEHQNVIDSVERVNALALVGEVGLRDVKRLAQTLANWFPGHADYMDSALSAWVNRKMYGGVPVVLRRDLSTAA